MSGKRIVIVTGGTLGDWVTQEIRQDDVLVGCDRGALFLVRSGLRPHIALGDFDSVSAEELDEIRAASREFADCDPVLKDLTDTEMALEWAMANSPGSIVLLGALGTRFDHSLSNIHLLRKAADHGIPCIIIDACNEVIAAVKGRTKIRKSRYTHVSLLPLSMEVTGITLHGFQYPLHQATLQIGQSLGVSNVLLEDTGTIDIDSGYLLVIQSKD